MLGAGDGGAFIGRGGFPEHVIYSEAVFRKTGGGELDPNFVSAVQGAKVAGFAFCDGNNHAVVGEKGGERDAGGSEGFLVGFVADGEVAGEEDHPGGVGVGEVDVAGVGEGHGHCMECPMTNVQ
ncbi:MAG: hypothetical protein RL376_1947 [Verrucomicrobiota bacterium]